MPQVFAVEVIRKPDGSESSFQFQLSAGVANKVLEEALKLRRDIESTNLVMFSILRRIGRSDLYDSYVTQLEECARLAFSSDLPDFVIGSFMLERAKSDFVARVGQRYRIWHIKRMSAICLLIGLPSLLYGAYFSGPIENLVGFTDGIRIKVYFGIWILFGVANSVWLSTVLRNRRLEWSSLTIFDPDGFPPILRFFLVCSVTFLFALLLTLKIVNIGIGSVNLGDFLSNAPAAILIPTARISDRSAGTAPPVMAGTRACPGYPA